MKIKKKTLLITGGCGFIGSHLTDFFLSKEIKVYVLDKKGKRFSPNWLNKYKNKDLKIYYNDVRNKKFVEKLVKQVDYVIHLAALISIPHSYKYPEDHISTNIIGTFNILESCRKYNKRCIITSSSETYGSGVKFPMDENHRLFAQSPYAATKISADQLALSYYNSFNTKVKIIRPFNCFGPRQSPRAVIPNMILQIINRNKNIKIGNVKTFRDYTFVEDLCNAYWKLYKLEKGYGEIFNVGSEKTNRIYRIFRLISLITKFNGTLKLETKRVRPSKSEVIKLHSSSKKFKLLFKWKTKTNLKEGLEKTIDWYIKNQKVFQKVYNKYSI